MIEKPSAGKVQVNSDWDDEQKRMSAFGSLSTQLGATKVDVNQYIPQHEIQKNAEWIVSQKSPKSPATVVAEPIMARVETVMKVRNNKKPGVGKKRRVNELKSTLKTDTLPTKRIRKERN